MRNYSLAVIISIFPLFIFSHLSAQRTDRNNYNYGIWPTFGDALNQTTTPKVRTQPSATHARGNGLQMPEKIERSMESPGLRSYSRE